MIGKLNQSGKSFKKLKSNATQKRPLSERVFPSVTETSDPYLDKIIEGRF